MDDEAIREQILSGNHEEGSQRAIELFPLTKIALQ